jgi:C4-dicarboxylate-specific signal transduction histidine kinase
LTAEGGLNEFQAVGRDVTDRKQVEEADRKLAQAMRLASLGELTAVVSHEISQPLLAMQSNAEAADNLLQSQDPPIDELRTIIADIRKDNLRVGEVIRIVRALFQKHDVDLRCIDINQVVDRVARLTGADACRRHVQWIQDIAIPLPAVLGDTASLEQVLLNLVMNAMDAMNDTPESERKLIVATRASDDGGVLLSVADRGHGIAPDSMTHLFDSFFTTKAQGMGLGLSTSRSIVIAHRGRIWAANGIDGGATFYIWLPPAPASLPTTKVGPERPQVLKFGAPPGVLSGLEVFQSNRKHSSAKKRWKQVRLGTLSVDN